MSDLSEYVSDHIERGACPECGTKHRTEPTSCITAAENYFTLFVIIKVASGKESKKYLEAKDRKDAMDRYIREDKTIQTSIQAAAWSARQ